MHRIRRRVLLATLACVSDIAALPGGLEVISGDARANIAENSLTIESGNKAILQWNDFSIGKNEIAKFIQQDRHSTVLNRVMGGSESSILGLLESNGRVYLINPNGVFIGPGARIETSGFIASTFDVLNDDFLQGNALLFKGDSNRPIQNLGTIACPDGNIHLFAAHIINEGSLQAPQGRVVLASGGDILLQKDGSSNIYIRPILSEEVKEGAAIDHRGSITALTVELQAGASPYAKAIQCSGQIEAVSIQEIGGDIRLVAEKGITEVDGGSLTAIGGTVHVLGEKVGLQKDARIDVSGASSGGTILIGGDFQGGNPEIQNAVLTFISPETEIKADALQSGNGGKVIVWSDEATFAYGNISARGGEVGGDGGFVEVSGKHLDFQGFADRRAPNGDFGTLLLDPVNVTISTGANANQSFAANTYSYTGVCPAAVTINTTSLVGNLNAGNVTINTNMGACASTGTITVSNDIGVTTPWTAATTLTMTANATITISAGAAITNSYAGAPAVFNAMNFTANNTPLVSASGVQINAALTCSGSGGGNIVLSGKGGPGGAKSGVAVAAAVTTSTGNITFSNSTGGNGGAGSNRGVNIGSAVSSTSGSIFFSNCTGGTGTTSVGVGIVAGVSTTSGAVTFSNCMGAALGGGGGSTSAGVRVEAGGTISAPIIDATVGITGSNNANPFNHGFHVTGGTVGSASTTSLSITATGGGTAASEQGIRVDSGTIQIGNTGTMTLIGFGSPTGTNSCIGIDIEAAGTISGGDAAKLFLTGTDRGTGAVNNGFGIAIGGPLTAGTMALTSTANITLNGMAGPGTAGTNRGTISQAGGSITLVGIGTVTISGTGGTGTGIGNGGVDINSPVTALNGNLVFSNCFGGMNATSSSHGLRFQNNAVIDVKTLTATTNIQGGTGILSNGISVDALSTVGSANTTSLTMTGTAPFSSDIGRGMNIGGTIQVGSGTLALNGTGSPVGATFSVGISIAAAGKVSGSNAAILTLTGVGGNGAKDINIDTVGATSVQSDTGSITLNGTTNGIGLGNTIINKSGAGANGITINGPVTLVANAPTLTTGGTGPIFFSSTIDGAFNLSVNAGGLVTFSGAIGSITPLASLNLLAASAFNVGGNITLSSATLSFPSPVVLIGNSTMTIASGGTTTFTSTVNGPGGLGIDSGAGGSVVFNAPLGGITPLGSISVTGMVNNPTLPLTATASGPMTFNQLILTAGAVNGGDVTLTSSGNSITVNDIDASGAAGNGGHIFLQPGSGSSSTSLGATPAGKLVFAGTSITSTGAVTPGAIHLSAAGRATPQSIATIVGMQNLTITGGTFVMGPNESMTVLGDLTIDPPVVTLSDIVTLGKLSVTGSSITLNLQPPAIYLSSNGMFYISADAHLISGGTSFFSTPVLPAGARVRTTTLSSSDLLFSGTVLNFDFVDFNTFFQLVFDAAVANSQLGRLLPIIRPLTQRVFPVYRICSIEELGDQPCVIDFEPFIFESDIMTDASREKIGI